MNIHIIKDTKDINPYVFNDDYKPDDLVIMIEDPICVFKVGLNYMFKITNDEHRLILGQISYEEIVEKITNIHNNSSLELLKYNKYISLTEEQFKSLELLKEMI